MTKILISYSRKDSVIARKLMQGFRTLDLDVWVDWEDIPPAVGWLEQIERGIEESDAFIFLISPDSIVSEVCKVEIEHARKNQKRIVPILIRDVAPKDVVPAIRDLNWIYLREQDDFKEGLEKVKVAITLDIEWVEEHRRLQVRALEWDRKKDPSLLLRGGDLRRARHMLAKSEKHDPKPSQLQQTYILYSIEDERRKTILWISAAAAIIIMLILSMVAVQQWRLAAANEKIAQQQRQLAEENEQLALENAKLANEARVIASSQRSAARAQIYQSRAGGLFTSTLLAIDSWQRSPSDEAEEILRKNISLLPIPVGKLSQSGLISTIELNPLGDVFVSASFDGTACVSNIKDGTNVYCVESAGAVQDAAFSPDGKTIVTADDEGVVNFIDAQDGTILESKDYGVPVWDVNISPSGKSLAVARDDGIITIVDMATYGFNYDLITQGSLQSISFSPSGEWVAAGTNIGTVTLWNLKTGKIVSGPSHRGEVLDIAFSPDSSKLISGGTDNVVIVIQTYSGEELFRRANEDWVEDVTFSPDGKWFVTASDDYRIRVWDAITGEEKLRLLQNGYLSEVQVSPDGQWIASTGWDHTARVWSVATGAEIYQVPLTDKGNTVTFSLDGNYLIVGEQEGDIGIWDISNLSIAKGYLQFNGLVQNIQYSSSGEWIAASSAGDVWLLDPSQISTLTAPQSAPVVSLKDDSIEKLLVSSDSDWIALVTQTGDVILYDTADRTQKTLLESTQEVELAFSTDNENLIVADAAGQVRLWNMETGQAGDILLESAAKVESLAVHENQLAIGLLDKVTVIDLNTGEVISEAASPGEHHLMVFSPDGEFLAANNTLGQIYIWRVGGANLELLQNISSEQTYSMAFDPGGRLFVGVLGNVYVLDPATGTEITRIRQRDLVSGLSFSPDGSTLATTSWKAVQFWDVEKIAGVTMNDLIQTACSRLTQNFTSVQWTSFFEDEPYRKLCEDLPSP
jgi:WD40 repeat protein